MEIKSNIETEDSPHLSPESVETLIYLLGRVEDFAVSSRPLDAKTMFLAAKWAREALNKETK